ncbi:MAG: SMP-30/gluconolactonase/LRE family protein [Proteobacteria bacterium]|nr:SMP-30/gluconolactonase/LRE family protein [Pseudomonadota bacterium]
MDLSQVKTVGSGIIRPEGVMALDDGTVLTADARGRIARIRPNGVTDFYGDLNGVPNGICLDASGNCIVANIGNGQVQSLSPDGSHRVILTEAEGRLLPTPNFPFVDTRGRLWVSNSSDREDLDQALQNPAPDGCVALLDNGRASVAADRIFFANGVALDREEAWLYVAATLERAVLRYRIEADGALSGRQHYGPVPLADLGYPDGIAFDEAGHLWVTFPAMNAVGYITPGGALQIVLHDPEGRLLKRPTNICFGGPDRRTAYLGSLDGSFIPCFQVPWPGMKLVHQR